MFAFLSSAGCLLSFRRCVVLHFSVVSLLVLLGHLVETFLLLVGHSLREYNEIRRENTEDEDDEEMYIS